LNDIEIAPPSVVLQAAADFSYALTETVEYKSFERADDFLRKDVHAQQALSEFQKKWKSSEALMRLNALGIEEQQELERLRQAYITKPSVVAYVQAQADLVELCRVAGNSISQATGLNYAAVCSSGCCG